MGLFAKEKDIFLKIVNSILIVGLVFSIIILLGTGIKIVNKETANSYDEYKNEVCELDKIPSEEIDSELTESNCYTYYLEDKKEKEQINKSNNENFLISLVTSAVLFISMHLLNKKYN